MSPLANLSSEMLWKRQRNNDWEVPLGNISSFEENYELEPNEEEDDEDQGEFATYPVPPGSVVPGHIEPYILEEKFQECLYGVVFRGRGLHTGDNVAVKLLLKNKIEENESDRELPETPLAEVFFAPHLHGHPNIFTIREVFEVDLFHFVISDMAQGEDLLELLKLHPVGMPETFVRFFMLQAAQALVFAHSRRVAMHDFSLENCLLFVDSKKRSYQIRVCDPGQAIRFPVDSNGNELPVTYAGCVGKRFRPPEIFTKMPYLASRVDSWCLGWSTFYLLFAVDILESAWDGDRDPRWKYFCSYRYEELFHELGVSSRFSSTAKDFILRLMHPRAEFRITVAEALKHPFLSGPGIPAHLGPEQLRGPNQCSLQTNGEVPSPKISPACDFYTKNVKNQRFNIPEELVARTLEEARDEEISARQKLSISPIIPEMYFKAYAIMYCKPDKPSGTLLPFEFFSHERSFSRQQSKSHNRHSPNQNSRNFHSSIRQKDTYNIAIDVQGMHHQSENMAPAGSIHSTSTIVTGEKASDLSGVSIRGTCTRNPSEVVPLVITSDSLGMINSPASMESETENSESSKSNAFDKQLQLKELFSTTVDRFSTGPKVKPIQERELALNKSHTIEIGHLERSYSSSPTSFDEKIKTANPTDLHSPINKCGSGKEIEDEPTPCGSSITAASTNTSPKCDVFNMSYVDESKNSFTETVNDVGTEAKTPRRGRLIKPHQEGKKITLHPEERMTTRSILAVQTTTACAEINDTIFYQTPQLLQQSALIMDKEALVDEDKNQNVCSDKDIGIDKQKPETSTHPDDIVRQPRFLKPSLFRKALCSSPDFELQSKSVQLQQRSIFSLTEKTDTFEPIKKERGPISARSTITYPSESGLRSLTIQNSEANPLVLPTSSLSPIPSKNRFNTEEHSEDKMISQDTKDKLFAKPIVQTFPSISTHINSIVTPSGINSRCISEDVIPSEAPGFCEHVFQTLSRGLAPTSVPLPATPRVYQPHRRSASSLDRFSAHSACLHRPNQTGASIIPTVVPRKAEVPFGNETLHIASHIPQQQYQAQISQSFPILLHRPWLIIDGPIATESLPRMSCNVLCSTGNPFLEKSEGQQMIERDKQGNTNLPENIVNSTCGLPYTADGNSLTQKMQQGGDRDRILGKPNNTDILKPIDHDDVITTRFCASSPVPKSSQKAVVSLAPVPHAVHHALFLNSSSPFHKNISSAFAQNATKELRTLIPPRSLDVVSDPSVNLKDSKVRLLPLTDLTTQRRQSQSPTQSGNIRKTELLTQRPVTSLQEGHESCLSNKRSKTRGNGHVKNVKASTPSSGKLGDQTPCKKGKDVTLTATFQGARVNSDTKIQPIGKRFPDVIHSPYNGLNQNMPCVSYTPTRCVPVNCNSTLFTRAPHMASYRPYLLNQMLPANIPLHPRIVSMPTSTAPSQPLNCPLQPKPVHHDANSFYIQENIPQQRKETEKWTDQYSQNSSMMGGISFSTRPELCSLNCLNQPQALFRQTEEKLTRCSFLQNTIQSSKTKKQQEDKTSTSSNQIITKAFRKRFPKQVNFRNIVQSRKIHHYPSIAATTKTSMNQRCCSSLPNQSYLRSKLFSSHLNETLTSQPSCLLGSEVSEISSEVEKRHKFLTSNDVQQRNTATGMRVQPKSMVPESYPYKTNYTKNTSVHIPTVVSNSVTFRDYPTVPRKKNSTIQITNPVVTMSNVGRVGKVLNGNELYKSRGCLENQASQSCCTEYHPSVTNKSGLRHQQKVDHQHQHISNSNFTDAITYDHPSQLRYIDQPLRHQFILRHERSVSPAVARYPHSASTVPIRMATRIPFQSSNN